MEIIICKEDNACLRLQVENYGLCVTISKNKTLKLILMVTVN
jgi:hypothetical protein